MFVMFQLFNYELCRIFDQTSHSLLTALPILFLYMFEFANIKYRGKYFPYMDIKYKMW